MIDSLKLIRLESKPTLSQALTLLPTYVRLAPSLPTIIAARCGGLLPLAVIDLTSKAISFLISLLIFFPSSTTILLFKILHHIH